MELNMSVDDTQTDFTPDTTKLYREETITDLKVASIKIMIPIKLDGSDDEGRTPIYIGNTQLMSPEGPLPLQAPLAAENLEQALAVFPEAMRQALADVVEKIKEMQLEQRRKEMGAGSGIIIPGR
jgi:hypothetical protein